MPSSAWSRSDADHLQRTNSRNRATNFSGCSHGTRWPAWGQIQSCAFGTSSDARRAAAEHGPEMFWMILAICAAAAIYLATVFPILRRLHAAP